MNKIAVAIVHYNTIDHLRHCLESVIPEKPCEIVVVDNASSDNSPEMVRREFPEVLLQANQTNDGFGAAANQAIAACHAPYVLLLNADTRVYPGALEALETYLDDHARAGLVGPKLVNKQGGFEVSWFPFPTPINVFLDLFQVGSLLRHLPFPRRGDTILESRGGQAAASWLVGAAMAIRRTAFDEVYGFDTSFFMFSEEVDLCYRLEQQGWQVHINPHATVKHVGGASTQQRRVEMDVRSLLSTMTFYRRHYSRRRLQQLRLIVAVAMCLRLLRDGWRLQRWASEDTARRKRLVEDLQVWQRVLRGLRHR